MTFLVQGMTKIAGGQVHARQIGEYWTFEEAVTAAKQVIDTFLYREYRRGIRHGMTSKKLLTLYKRAGEAIYIVRKVASETSAPRFDYFKYAAEKCKEICGSGSVPPSPANKLTA